MRTDVTHAYIGTKACGCTVAATVDDPKHQKEIAKDVRDFISRGYTIDRIPLEEVRTRVGPCRCAKPSTAPLPPEVLELFARNP